MFWANFETILETFDPVRATNGLGKIGNIHYEGGPQFSVSTNLNNGTNGTGPAWYTDLANKITALGWNVAAFTVSGTNNVTELANQVVNMIQGWKLDITISGSVANNGSYKIMIKTKYYSPLVAASAGSGREVRGAQFGYEQDTWAYFPQPYQLGGQYASYEATHEFNA